MFITYLSTTCFGAYGHLQVDELTKTHKQLHLACVFYTEEGGGGVIGCGYEISCILGTEGVYMGFYYANLSFV
jgi:hypothetical protein